MDTSFRHAHSGIRGFCNSWMPVRIGPATATYDRHGTGRVVVPGGLVLRIQLSNIAGSSTKVVAEVLGRSGVVDFQKLYFSDYFASGPLLSAIWVERTNEARERDDLKTLARFGESVFDDKVSSLCWAGRLREGMDPSKVPFRLIETELQDGRTAMENDIADMCQTWVRSLS